LNESLEYYRRHLPHYQPGNAIYFVTFRLADSLPKAVLDKIKDEYSHQYRLAQRMPDKLDREKRIIDLKKKRFGNIDKFLDRCGSGPLWLREDRIAEIVQEAIQYRDGKEFDVHAYCIMPNHVHIVFAPIGSGRRISSPYIVTDILENLKWFTAKESNAILGRKGKFWQHESYDHVVRDEKEYFRVIQYVLNNPVKAGLVSEWRDWKWSYSKYPI